jgi:hypothetical protein
VERLWRLYEETVVVAETSGTARGE